MFCTRFIQVLNQCRSFSTTFLAYTSKESNSEFIRKALGCDKSQWDKEANSFLENYEKDNLHNSVNTLKKLGYSEKDISGETRVIAIHSHTLLSRYRILCDYCFQRNLITTTLLRRFTRHFSLDLHELKRQGYINKYKDVLGRMNKKLNVQMDHLQETMPLKRIHYEYMVVYLMNTLSISQEEAKYNLRMYINLKARSFRCMSDNYKLLTTKMQFDFDKIRKHVYVLHADRDNMLALLKAFPKNGPLDIIHTVNSYPNLLLSPVRNMLAVIECLHRFGYGIEHIKCIPMILLLKPATLEARLSRLHTEAWFQPYVGLPRALTLVFNLPGVERRRKILDELNMKCVSINTLASSGGKFNAYARHGRDKLTSVDGFKYLGTRLNVSQKEVFAKLKSHPYLRYVSLQQIHNSLNFLLDQFSEDLIYQSLQLVLYPVNTIEDALSKIRNPALINTSPCHDASGQIQSKFLLPLTLYMIEKDSNFSGYAVWENNEAAKSGDAEVTMLPIRKRKRKLVRTGTRLSVKL